MYLTKVTNILTIPTKNVNLFITLGNKNLPNFLYFILKRKYTMKEKIKMFNNWVGVDGKLHIAVSLIIYLFVAIPIFMCYGIFFSISVGFVISFMIGCIKELNDIYIQGDNTKIESNHDVICNLIGIGIGVIYNLFLILFIYNIYVK